MIYIGVGPSKSCCHTHKCAHTCVSRLSQSINLLSSCVAFEEVSLPLNVEESRNLNHQRCLLQEPHFIHLDHQGLWYYYHKIESAQYLVACVKYQLSFPVRTSSNIKERIKANNPYSMYSITNKRDYNKQLNIILKYNKYLFAH